MSTKNIQLKHPGTKKLLPLWIGPFKVLAKVGTLEYKLQLAEGMKMHDVFHVSLLKEFRSDGTVIPPPPPQLVAGELAYEVEQVIDYDSKRKRYLVKWQGYGHESNTWEPEKNLSHAAALVQGYWETRKLIQQHKAGGSKEGNDENVRTETQQPDSESMRASRRNAQRPSRYLS